MGLEFLPSRTNPRMARNVLRWRYSDKIRHCNPVSVVDGRDVSWTRKVRVMVTFVSRDVGTFIIPVLIENSPQQSRWESYCRFIYVLNLLDGRGIWRRRMRYKEKDAGMEVVMVCQLVCHPSRMKLLRLMTMKIGCMDCLIKFLGWHVSLAFGRLWQLLKVHLYIGIMAFAG
jgi:hypothetical protein